MDLKDKSQLLKENLASVGSLLVAYSGGTDSAYLAYAAYRVLGQRMLAVIADSPSLPRKELAGDGVCGAAWNSGARVADP